MQPRHASGGVLEIQPVRGDQTLAERLAAQLGVSPGVVDDAARRLWAGLSAADRVEALTRASEKEFLGKEPPPAGPLQSLGTGRGHGRCRCPRSRRVPKPGSREP